MRKQLCPGVVCQCDNGGFCALHGTTQEERQAMPNYDKCPEFLEGRQARRDGKTRKDNPYLDTVAQCMGFDVLWLAGWECEKDSEGSRYWCDHCRKPLYDATYCGNCGRPGTT